MAIVACDPISIDKGIPTPADRPRTKRRTLPFDRLEVGDSFFIPVMNANESKSIRSVTHAHAQRHGGKFATRRVEENGVEGIRIWRLK